MINDDLESGYVVSVSWRKPNHFHVRLNRPMDITNNSTLNAGGLYHILFFNSFPNDFNTLCDDNGYLVDRTHVITDRISDVMFNLGVEHLDEGEGGFDLYVNDGGDVQIDISEGEPVFVKGLVVAKSTGAGDYVVAYARFSSPVSASYRWWFLDGSKIAGHHSE